MSLLTNQDLSYARATVDESLPETAAIRFGTVFDDGGGGGTLTWQWRANSPCRIAPATVRGQEGPVADRLTADSEWVITFPAETEILTTDRVEIGTRTFEVEQVASPRSYETSCRVAANEVT